MYSAAQCIITRLSGILDFNWTIIVFCCGFLLLSKLFLNCIFHCCPWHPITYTARFMPIHSVLSILSHNKITLINFHFWLYLVSHKEDPIFVLKIVYIVYISQSLTEQKYVFHLINIYLLNMKMTHQALNKTVKIAFRYTSWLWGRQFFILF